MKICVIAPIGHLNDFCPFGDMDMSLASIAVNKDGSFNRKYMLFYSQQKAKGRFVILDNGACEYEKKTGKGMKVEDVLNIAGETDPSELICTDILFKSNETLESTREFIGVVKEGPFQDTSLMAVPQGNTAEEWFYCYKEMLKMPEINTIGLSKISTPMCFLGNRTELGAVAKARILCTSEIVARGLEPDKYGKVVHLLGSDAWIGYEVAIQSQYKWIRSLDSSAPVYYGWNGDDIDTETGRFKEMRIEKPDLENLDPIVAYNCENFKEKIYKNIAVVQKFAKGF